MITALTDLSKIPNQSQDQATFDANMAYTLEQLPERARQENELAANLNAIAAGGAYAFQYVFDSATTDADPGTGKLRLGSSTQNASTVLRIDNAMVGGTDLSAVWADLLSVTSGVKGSLRLVKRGDPSKWIILDVTGSTAATGYRNLTVSVRASSSANPFALNDELMVHMQRSGDVGAGALVLLASATVSAAVAQINFLTLFSTSYDKYLIEIQGATPASNTALSMRLATNGAAVNSTLYYGPAAAATNMVAASSFAIATVVISGGPNSAFSLELRNVNAAGSTGLSARGMTGAANGGISGEGLLSLSEQVTGFQLFWNNGANFTAGTVRVYGILN